MKTKFQFFCIIWLVLQSTIGFSQAPTLSEKAKVTVLTCGSGEDLYAVFGHTAIRILDPVNQIDTVFNYGTFDFDTSFFYLKFMYGNLEYFLSSSTYQDFVYHYQISNRSVFEQELILDKKVKQHIFNKLYNEIKSEDKNYTYQFIETNCTTKVADILKEFIPKNNIKESYSNIDELSYRGIINNYLGNRYFEKLGINLLFGLKTDRLSDKIFLPDDLMRALTTAKSNNKDLSAGTENIYLKSEEERGIIWWNNVYIVLALFLIIILLKKQKLDIIFIKTIGFFGVFMLLFSLISKHHEVSLNLNILLFNPLLLLLANAYHKNNEKNFKRITWFLIGSAVIFIFKTLNTSSFYIIIPFVLPLAIIIYRLPFYKTKINDDEMIQNALN
ncbi:MAG: DUF4105 domain-containing protein [Flavobacterium sp.]